jgi:hypothetical protein
VDQGIKHECKDSLAGSIGKLGSEDYDSVSALRPEGDALDLGVTCDACSWSYRTKEANLEGAAHNSSYLSPNGLDDQSLVDSQGVEAACNEATEWPLGSRASLSVCIGTGSYCFAKPTISSSLIVYEPSSNR